MSLFCSRLHLCILLLFFLPLAKAAETGSEKPLRKGSIEQHQMSSDEIPVYSIEISAGQFLHLVVEQQGVDLVLVLQDPDKKQLIEIDSPNGSYGLESIFVIAEKSGLYRLKLHSINGDAPPGKYKLEVVELRDSKQEDTDLVAAQENFLIAQKLEAVQTAESRQQAITSYQQALNFWKKCQKVYEQATVINAIASLHYSLGDRERSIEEYKQALSLFRSLDNLSGQVGVLNSIGLVYDTLGDKTSALDYCQESLVLAKKMGSLYDTANALNSIGLIYDSIAETEKALNYFEQALPIWESLKEKKGQAKTLNNFGAIYNSLGERKRALDYYNRALLCWKSANDKEGEAITLGNIGLTELILGNTENALDHFNQALNIFRVIGDRGNEANSINSIATVYNLLGESKKAMSFYQEALTLVRSTGDKPKEISVLNNIGRVYSLFGEKELSLENYEQALKIAKVIGDKESEAQIIANIGTVYDSVGEKQTALRYLEESLILHKAVNNRTGQASTLSNMGSIYDVLGEKKKALDYLHEALQLRRVVDDKDGESSTLNNIGHVYTSTDEYQKAFEYFKLALDISKSIGDKTGQATILNNIGLVHSSLGESQKALDYFNQSLFITQETGDRQGQATTLNNIGSLYYTLGKNEKAVDYLNRSLSLLQTIGDKRGQAGLLTNLGGLYGYLREYNKGLDYCTQALQILDKFDNRNIRAQTFNNLGVIYSSLDETEKSLGYYEQALTLLQITDDKSGETRTLSNIGKVYKALGDNSKAISYYNKGLLLARQIEDKYCEARLLFNIASLKHSDGELDIALKFIEEALSIIESLRVKIDIKDLRLSYFSSNQDYYELYVKLLMDIHKQKPSLGYDALALQVSERTRARSLLDTLAEAHADIREGIDRSLLKQEQSLHQRLNRKLEHQVNLLSNKSTSNNSEQLVVLKKEIESINEELQAVEAKIRKQSPKYAALNYPKILNLEQIQKEILDNETMLLEYFLGQDSSYLWVVTKDSIKSFELPKREEIESFVIKLRLLISERSCNLKHETVEERRERIKKADTQYQTLVTELSNILLAEGLKLKPRLAVVADGILNLLPFAALLDSKGRYLVVNHEIVNLPSASSLSVIRNEKRAPATKTIAVLADPVFSIYDERVSSLAEKLNKGQPLEIADKFQYRSITSCRDVVKLERLPGTRIEAKSILSLVPKEQRFEAIDFEANLSRAIDPEMGKYKIVHFGTHGFVPEDSPELVGLVLSLIDKNGNKCDGYMSFSTIYNLKLPIELVTLSGCETGLGKEIKGEGLLGLIRGFMYAGSKRVVASLWKVNDRSTAELMKHFYHMILVNKLSPATALRKAQLSMLQTKTWQSPYYWASFHLQGEWK